MQFSLAVAAASAFFFASSAVASSATVNTLDSVFVSLNKTVGTDLAALSTFIHYPPKSHPIGPMRPTLSSLESQRVRRVNEMLTSVEL